MNESELKQLKSQFKKEYNKDFSEDLSAFISYCNLNAIQGLRNLVLELMKEIKTKPLN